MRKTITWILVADGANARVVVNKGPGRGLEPAPETAFAPVLAPPREEPGERPGRVQESARPGRHAIEPRTPRRRLGKQIFAKAVAKRLDEAAERNAFDRLILVAPPRTLGDLRTALGLRARGRIVGELDKDLTQVTIAELPDHLYKLLPL